MTRLAAYLGPPARISTVVELGSSSLLTQAEDSRDGFGIGWYPSDADPDPVRILSERPLSRDHHLMGLVRRYSSSCVLASARRANGPSERSGLQPFKFGHLLFHHTGDLERFHQVFERPLRAALSDEMHATLRGNTASEVLFALWLDALGNETTADAMANALESMVNIVLEVAAPTDSSVAFSTVVTDGRSLITLRTSNRGTPPSLYTTVAADGSPVPATGRVIASEPLFPGEWTGIDPFSLTIFTLDPTQDEIARSPA